MQSDFDSVSHDFDVMLVGLVFAKSDATYRFTFSNVVGLVTHSEECFSINYYHCETRTHEPLVVELQPLLITGI